MGRGWYKFLLRVPKNEQHHLPNKIKNPCAWDIQNIWIFHWQSTNDNRGIAIPCTYTSWIRITTNNNKNWLWVCEWSTKHFIAKTNNRISNPSIGKVYSWKTRQGVPQMENLQGSSEKLGLGSMSLASHQNALCSLLFDEFWLCTMITRTSCTVTPMTIHQHPYCRMWVWKKTRALN